MAHETHAHSLRPWCRPQPQPQPQQFVLEARIARMDRRIKDWERKRRRAINALAKLEREKRKLTRAVLRCTTNADEASAG